MLKALCLLGAVAVVVLWARGGVGRAADEKAATGSPEITITGSMLCQRACVPEVWDHSPTSGDHTLVLFALEGTPQIEAELASIMKECWPGDALDCDQAVKLSAEFDRWLKYYLAPSPLVNSYHQKVEYPALAMSVTGVVSERDAKKWIDVSRIDPAKLTYPARMLVPDTPLVTPDEEPLLLDVTDTITIAFVRATAMAGRVSA